MRDPSTGRFTGYQDNYQRVEARVERASRLCDRAIAAWNADDPEADYLLRRARRFAVQVLDEIEALEDSET